MALAVSAILFAVFSTSVVMGSVANASFLGDLGEMLVLGAAALSFVVAILRKEREAADRQAD